jgi:hypothetical protein
MKKSPVSRKSQIQVFELLRTSTGYGALLTTYRDRVLAQKTRTIRLLGRKSSAKILHTLLGYEVQASYKRIQCPDMPTARYLRLFSELGCHSIKLPYDPTLTEELVPGFEATIDGIKEEISSMFPGDIPTQQYAIRRAYEIIRRQLTATAG